MGAVCRAHCSNCEPALFQCFNFLTLDDFIRQVPLLAFTLVRFECATRFCIIERNIMNLEPADYPVGYTRARTLRPHFVLALKLQQRMHVSAQCCCASPEVCGRPCLECTAVGRTRLQVEHDGARFLPFTNNDHAIEVHDYIITFDCDFNVRHATATRRADVVGRKRMQLWVVLLWTEAVGLEVILAAIVLAVVVTKLLTAGPKRVLQLSCIAVPEPANMSSSTFDLRQNLPEVRWCQSCVNKKDAAHRKHRRAHLLLWIVVGQLFVVQSVFNKFVKRRTVDACM